MCIPSKVASGRTGTSGGSSSSSSNRSRVLINGVPTSLRVVRSVSDVLVDMNGQAASLALRDTYQQLLLLDRIAGWCLWGGAGGRCVGMSGTTARSSCICTSVAQARPQWQQCLVAAKSGRKRCRQL
jgi:hypothetical protein